MKTFQIDLAYQLRIGQGDEDSNLLDVIGEGALENADLDSFQHLFLFSIVYRYG